MSAPILAGAVVLWGGVHSWLASLPAKAGVIKAFGESGRRGYRLAYNAAAVMTFLPILLLMRVLPDRLLYFVGSPWRYIMVAIELIAAMLLALALLATDTLHFAGLRQLVEGDAPSRLVTGGFYRWVRHPLYLFGLVILWLTPVMTTNMLVVFGMLTVYIIAGAAFEERRLLREFGDAYRSYRERTPMLIPGVRLRGNRTPDIGRHGD